MEKFRIIQITDTHIQSIDEPLLYGVDVRKQLRLCFDHIIKKNIEADLLLLTGDISHDDSQDSYDFVKEQCLKLNCPVYRINGNHDVKASFEAALQGGHFKTDKTFEKNGWAFILLDSCIPEQKDGRLEASELDFLKEKLAFYKDKHVVVVLHHDSFNLPGNMRKYPLHNRDELNEILDVSPNVKLVLHGHVHQEASVIKNGYTVLYTPATCMQIVPLIDEFKIDEIPSGYRVIDFFGDSIRTHVERFN